MKNEPTNAQTKEAAYERLRQVQLNFRLGRISLAELNAARRAYNRAMQSENFDKQLEAARKMVKP